jgi:hypothetical protein
MDALAAASGPPFCTLTYQATQNVLGDLPVRADRRFTATESVLQVSAAEIATELQSRPTQRRRKMFALALEASAVI